MSARAAVFLALSTDPILTSVHGINANRVWPAQALDVAPRKGPFLIMRWEEETTVFNRFGRAEAMTVWAHIAREASTDFATLAMILERVTEVLCVLEGPDVTAIDYNGMSPDLNDEGYKTITKNAAYRVVSR